MKILYLKGYRWLLSQTQRVKNHFFGYRRYKTLAKHIRPFLKTSEKMGNERKSVPQLYGYIKNRPA